MTLFPCTAKVTESNIFFENFGEFYQNSFSVMNGK